MLYTVVLTEQGLGEAQCVPDRYFSRRRPGRGSLCALHINFSRTRLGEAHYVPDRYFSRTRPGRGSLCALHSNFNRTRLGEAHCVLYTSILAEQG